MKKICTTTARVAQLANVAQPPSAVRALGCQVVIVVTLCAISVFAQDKKADLIFANGDIYVGATINGNQIVLADSTRGNRATAIAVADGKIIGIAPDVDFEKRFKGPHTQIIDLHGHFVMPGFNDAHTHIASAGAEKLNVNLVGAKSLEEMQSRIAAKVKTTAPGGWIQGEGWDHTMWPGRTLPTRQDLDKVTGDHPAIFGRVDGHIAVANSAALKAAGITKDTQAKPGSAIDHDANGEPTGILREGPAVGLVYAKIPPPTAAERRQALELALKEAAESGVTSVQDYSGWEDFLVLEQLEKEGKLTARVSEWLTFGDSLDTLKKQRAHHPADDPMLHTGMLKGFMDGSLGSRTAALLAPYADDPKNSGLARFKQDDLNRMTKERAGAGFQIGFHAIGDRAIEMALTAFDEAIGGGCVQTHKFTGPHKDQDKVTAKQCYVQQNRRFRIEHDQIVQADQIQKYYFLGVIASVQPNHLLTDMRWVEDRIGKERAATSYPWKSFLDAGVPICFGTDYPVEPIRPFRGVYSAVTRKNEAGTQEFFPKEKLTIDQAIAAYTTGSAYAQFAEKEKGTLAPGMLADFVVLDRDITKVPPAEILKTKVLRTVVGGKTVYEASSVAADVATPGSGPASPNTEVRGNIDILSDTQGVDFAPYLQRVLQVVKRNWYAIIPNEAKAPTFKQGKVAITFLINKDGHVKNMTLATPAGDMALDRAAWGSITGSDPFPPLPREFHGENLALRFRFYYNPSRSSELQ